MPFYIRVPYPITPVHCITQTEEPDFFLSTQATRSAIALRLLPSAFGIALKPTALINVHGAFPKNRSIGGAVGATLGNAPYKIGDCTILKPTALINVHGAFPKNRSLEQWEPH